MKVVFTSLGPDRAYTDINGIQYRDGDCPDLEQEDYNKAVLVSKFAQDYTPELEERTKRLVAAAAQKRQEILTKMTKLQK